MTRPFERSRATWHSLSVDADGHREVHGLIEIDGLVEVDRLREIDCFVKVHGLIKVESFVEIDGLVKRREGDLSYRSDEGHGIGPAGRSAAVACTGAIEHADLAERSN